MASRKILLFSDGSQIFSALNWFFSDKGHQVTTFYTGPAALKALSLEGFDLVIARFNRERLDYLRILKTAKVLKPGIKAILLRGDHEVNSPIEAYQLEGEEEIFIPCGWAGLHRVAVC